MQVSSLSMRHWLLPLVLFVFSAPLWLHTFEPAMFVRINALCASVAAPVWTGLSLLGNAWGVLGVTAPLLVLSPRLLWAWLCAAPFAIVFARVGKGLIESPRPAAIVDNAQMRVVGDLLHNVSMPSGHTLTAFTVATSIYFALPERGRVKQLWLFVLAAPLGTRVPARMVVRHLQPTAWSQRLVAVVLVATATPC